MNVHYTPILCKSCMFCIKFCPKGVLEMGTERNAKGFFIPVVAHPEKCTACGICAKVCPDGAIAVTKDE